MISKEQYSNLSCFEELDIRCTMYGHEMSDVVEECGISNVDKNGVRYCIIPTASGLIWFLNGSRIDPPEVWDGDFSPRSNDLVSLTGCPKKVSGDFNCSWNKLSSLLGSPSEVGGFFNCIYNELSSLSGAPSKVGGNFYCTGNKLTSLSGAPSEVNGSFYCGDNRLISLVGAPTKVDGYFGCRNNTVKFSEEDVRKVSTVRGKVYI